METVVLSFSIKLILQFIPFRHIARHLGQQTLVTNNQTLSDYEQQQAKRISWAVRLIGYRTRWRNSCLVNSIIAKIMLRRRQISTQLFLGLAKDNQRNLQAHAWLRCGDFIVTGQETHKRFVVMSAFVE